MDTPTLIRYIFVGGTTGLIFLCLTWFLVDGLHWHVTLGSSIALFLACTYNYLLHYHWTFSSNAPHGWALVKYVLVVLGALIVNALVMHFGVKVLAIHYLMVQLLASLMVGAWSLSFSYLWVFVRRI